MEPENLDFKQVPFEVNDTGLQTRLWAARMQRKGLRADSHIACCWFAVSKVSQSLHFPSFGDNNAYPTSFKILLKGTSELI